MESSDYNLRDIKLTLQITKVISIDKSYNLQHVKRIANELFYPYSSSHQLNYYILNDEIMNFENVNVLKTLSYYNTNEIIIRSSDNLDDIKQMSQTIADQFKSAKERYDEKYENPVQDITLKKTKESKNLIDSQTKLTVTHAYKNLEVIRKKLGDLNATKEDYLNANELINKSEQIIQNSRKILNDYNVNLSNKSYLSSSENSDYTNENNRLYHSKENRNNKCRSLNRKVTEDNNFNNTTQIKARTDLSKSGLHYNKILNTKDSNYNNYNLDPLFVKDIPNSNREHADLNNLSHTSFHTLNHSQFKHNTIDTPYRNEQLNSSKYFII
jgi:hypothetical protein